MLGHPCFWVEVITSPYSSMISESHPWTCVLVKIPQTRVRKCDAVEQGRVSRRARHVSRLAMRVGTTAPCSPASLVRISVTMPGLQQFQACPETLLAVQTVHVVNVDVNLQSHSHYTTTASTWLTRRPWFKERCGHTLIQRRPRSTNLCYSSVPNRCHGMSFEHGGVKQESVGNWPGPLSMVKKPKLELSSTNLSGVAVSSSSCSMWWKGEGVKLEGRRFGNLGRKVE